MSIDTGDIEIGQQSGVEVALAAPDDFERVVDRSRMSLYERYAHDPEALSVVQFALKLPQALSGKMSENPFPRRQDREGIKQLVKIQKDLIRTMVRITQGGKTPEDLEELNDFYTIASVMEVNSSQDLPWNLSHDRRSVATEARGWWNGIKAEVAMISALQYADYDIVIPESQEVIDVDYSGGTDFLAHKDGRVFAIDAKSNVTLEGKGYMVMDEPYKKVTDAVIAFSKRHFGEASLTQKTISINPKSLPSLRREDNQSKQLRNIRNFLTLPDEVENGFIEELVRMPESKIV